MDHHSKVTDTGWIGRRARSLRTAHGLTVADLAPRVGLSTAQLSRIESGDRQPSVGALISLARALGTTLSELVADEPAPDVHVVRATTASSHPTGSGTVTALSGPLPGIQALQLTLDPAAAPEPAVHDGEEWIRVLDGTAVLTVGGRRTDLQAGDAAHFRSTVPHSLTTPDAATVLLVTTGHHD